MLRTISIAFVTELFSPSIGGQEFRFLRLAQGLSKRGFNVAVYTTDHTGGTLPNEDSVNGVQVVRYLTLKNYVKPNSRSFSQLIKFVIATASLIKKLAREYDFIFVNQMPILHLFFLRGMNEVCIDWCEVYKRGTLKYLIKLASKRFTRGTAVSEIIGEEVKRLNPHMDLEVVRTPIDVDKYTPIEEKDPEMVLYVGRLMPHKNVLSLAEAIVYLNEKLHRRKRLVIVGDGPLRSLLEKRYRSYKYIEVLGRVDEEEKIELLKRSSVLAIPSSREGFPNIVAEAIASLTPVLTVGAALNNVYPFVERHGIGFVAPSPSPKHLAEVVTSVDEEKLKRATINELRLREEFREERSIGKFVHFIERGLR